MSEWIDINAADGSFRAYVALPFTSPSPCVIVLQEIFGVNADLRQTCDELAASGYVAISPDLFWRMKPGLDITDQTEAEWKTGMDFYNAFDIEKGVLDIRATIGRARAMPEVSGKVGMLGFCMGGLLTFITASRGQIDAAVVYYGGGTELHLSEATTLASPLIMHIGEEDEYISKDAQRQIKVALSGIPDVRVCTYPNAMHAFARHQGIHYNASAAVTANERTSAFLASRLRQ